MGLKENIFGATTTVNRNQRDHSQEQDALSDISGLLGNMALGSDPGDDALFRNRLLQGKGYQLANRGTRSRLDSADAMATLPEYGAQNALSMGIDTSKMSPEDLLKFAAQMAYSDKQNALALSHRNTSGSIDDQRQNAQNLTNSQSLSDVILQNKVLEGDNLVQSGFNLEDAATNASALNDANVRNVDQGTAKLLASMALAKSGTESGNKLTGAKKKRIELLAPAEVDAIKAKTTQTHVETSDASKKSLAQTDAIRSTTENNRIRSEKLAYLTTLQTLHERAKKAATQSKNTKEMEVADQEILKIKAEISKINATAEAVKDESKARTELTEGKTEMVETQTENLNLEQTNSNLESNATQDNIAAKTGLVGDQRTTEQTLLPRQSELIDAKANYWNTRGEKELSDIMINKAAGSKKTGTSQHDYRKTKTWAEMQYKIEDVGQKFIVEKEVPGALWGTNTEETATYLWPDDYTAISNILVPTMRADDATKSVAMGKAQEELVTMGKTDPLEIHAIIKTIMQSTGKSK